MTPFSPRPLDDLAAAVDYIQQFLARRPLDDAQTNVNEGVKEKGPVIQPVELFDDLGDVNVVDALTGDLPVFDGTNWNAQNYTPAAFGVGLSSRPATGKFEVRSTNLYSYLTDTTSPLSGARGWHLDKLSAADTAPHGFDFSVEGLLSTTGWGFGVDFDTNNANKRADWVSVYCYTANGGSGADVMRWSHEGDSSDSPSVKLNIGRAIGTPRANTEFVTIQGGDNATSLGGLRLTYWDETASRNIATWQNRSTNVYRTIHNFNDQFDLGVDRANAKVADFRLHDRTNNAVRWYVSAAGKFGVGTVSPTAQVHITRTAAAATPSNPGYLQIVAVADTALTASTEVSDVVLDFSATRQFSTGAITNQRAARFLAPTYAFVAASTITAAATVYIDNAPQAGTNATLTTSYPLWVDAGVARFDGNGTVCFEIGTSDTTALGAFYGRIPVTIPGVGTKYLSLYS